MQIKYVQKTVGEDSDETADCINCLGLEEMKEFLYTR